jgi:hypothetical protein
MRNDVGEFHRGPPEAQYEHKTARSRSASDGAAGDLTKEAANPLTPLIMDVAGNSYGATMAYRSRSAGRHHIARPLVRPKAGVDLEVAPRCRADDRFRRVSPVASRSREGPLTEPTAGVQPWPRERVLMPRSRHP